MRDGSKVKDINPFSVFAIFNRPLRLENRVAIYSSFIVSRSVANNDALCADKSSLLATKRLMLGFFRVQKVIEIGDRSFDGEVNLPLLNSELYDVVLLNTFWYERLCSRKRTHSQ